MATPDRLVILDDTPGCRHVKHRGSGRPGRRPPLFERALAIRERVLGPGHPDTVATRRALAELASEGGGPATGR